MFGYKWAPLCLLAGISTVSMARGTSGGNDGDSFGHVPIEKLIVMPDSSGHTDWISAINGAKANIHMTMYHLTDKEVISALVSAHQRNIDVRVIVDGKSLTGGYKAAIGTLTDAGVLVQPSSTAFSLTHSKEMTVDGDTAFIGAIDLTNTATNMRDFAVIIHDKDVINEVETVFQADWKNGETNSKYTPPVSNANLVWSPSNSNDKLVALIKSAKSTLLVESENLDATTIIDALNEAAAKGVTVSVILPECSLGNADLNYKGIANLKNVSVHMEHDGDDSQQPYMHSKLMVVDSTTVYVGSINLSFNSIKSDREVGLIFQDPTTAKKLASEFETDWRRSDTAASTDAACSKSSK